jgi:hypothetical protein
LLSNSWKTSIIAWTDTRMVIGVSVRVCVVNPTNPEAWNRRCQ